jgi:hypothetical protein
VKKRWAIAAAAAVCLGCAVPVEGHEKGGERGKGGDGWGPDSAYGRLFDPSTVETVRGEVMAVELINPRKGMVCGVCLTLRTAEGSLFAHLGPEQHISRQEMRIETQDTVEVTGSRIVFKGQPVIIAIEVRWGGRVFLLRDARGVPLWSGPRRR